VAGGAESGRGGVDTVKSWVAYANGQVMSTKLP
jgi:hypothetical protein